VARVWFEGEMRKMGIYMGTGRVINCVYTYFFCYFLSIPGSGVGWGMHPCPEPVTGFLNSLHLHTHLAHELGKIRSNQGQVRTGIHGLDLDCHPLVSHISNI
jgi:hypothetical protein